MPTKALSVKEENMRFILLASLVIFSVVNVAIYPWTLRLILGPAYLGAPLTPFLDMFGHLASAQAWANGFDVLNNRNPIDILNRPHHGPSWMLLMGYLGLGVKHTTILAITSIVGVITIGLVLLKPRKWVEVSLAWLVLCSPAAFFAYERANIDITLFCVLCGAVYLATKNSAWQGWLAWGLIAANIGFKYFPTVAFLVLTDSKWGSRRFLKFTVAGAVAVLSYLFFYWREVFWVKEQVSSMSSPFLFGGSMFWRLIGLPEALIFPLCASLVSLVMATGAFLAFRLKPNISEENEWPGTFFIFSASTLLFCFATSVSFEYRLIFMIPAFPLLFRIASDHNQSKYIRRASYLTIGLAIFQMWGDALFFFQAYAPENHTWDTTYLKVYMVAKNLLSWVLMTLLGWALSFTMYPRLSALLNDYKTTNAAKIPAREKI